MQISVKALTGKIHTLDVLDSDTVALVMERLPRLTGVDAASVDILQDGIINHGPGSGNGIVCVDCEGEQRRPETPISELPVGQPTLILRIRKRMDDELKAEDLYIIQTIVENSSKNIKNPTPNCSCFRTVGSFPTKWEAVLVVGTPAVLLGGINCVGLSYERQDAAEAEVAGHGGSMTPVGWANMQPDEE